MIRNKIISILLLMMLLLTIPACDMLGLSGPGGEEGPGTETPVEPGETTTASIEAFQNHEDIISTPIDDELAFIPVSDGEAHFAESDWNGGKYFIELSELDELGRVGICTALVDEAHFPDHERGSLSSVTPTGWKHDGKSNNHEYSFVPNRYIFNRCHTIAFSLSGIEAEKRALITGTRFFNIEGNYAYEELILDHLKEMDGTNGEPMHQVLIRVTPDFYEDNMLCHGITYEADCLQCDDINFSVYMFNKQPGVTIDYRTGENWANDSDTPAVDDEDVTIENATYILNTGSMKFHEIGASCAPDPDSANYRLTDQTRDEVVDAGYNPCGICKP